MVQGYLPEFTALIRRALITICCLNALTANAADNTVDNASGQPLPASNADSGNTPPPAAQAPAGDATNAATTDVTPPDQTAEQQTPPLPRVLPNEELQRHQGVMRFLDDNSRDREMVQLVADEISFYGLLLTETAGKPQGGILILHDDGQHGHWPGIVAPLREKLPANGWTTLSIELPDTPAAMPPARAVYETPVSDGTAEGTDQNGITTTPTADGTSNEAQPPASQTADNNTPPPAPPTDKAQGADTGAGKEPPLPRLARLPDLPPGAEPQAVENKEQEAADETYRRQMLQRIRAGVSYLNQLGQLNVVIIAVGSSADWAVDFMQQRPKTVVSSGKTGDQQDRGYTLVLIDATDSRLSQVPLAQKLGDLDMPVLDLVSPLGISPAWAIQQRAGFMRHRQRAHYQQIEVPAFALQYDDNNNIIRRVQGWLRSHAAGTELPTS